MKSKVGKALVLLIFVYLILVMGKGLLQLREAGGRVGEVENRLALERQRNEELKKKLEKAQSEEFVEKEARESLNMQKPGEVVVILPEPQVSQIEDSADRQEKEKSNLEKWLGLFK